MDQEFITIPEAARLTGQSDLTIMRAIKDCLQQPGVNAAEILRKEPRDNGFLYLVNKEVLFRELSKATDVPPASQRGEQEETSPKREQTLLEAKDEMIATLQKVVDTQGGQIEDLSGKIDQLIERDRETNILLKTLQDKLFLLEQARPTKKQA